MAEAYPPPERRHSSRPVGEDWKRLQRDLGGRRPELRAKRGTLTPAVGPRGYLVHVEGVGLSPALSPPTVTVGGQAVTKLRFGPDGTTLDGFVAANPRDDRLVVDYGFARTEVKLTRRTAWWHWFRPALEEGWVRLDRIVRRGLGRLP